jgi:hypothetical protein
MKKLIFSLATVALLGGVFAQPSAAKAELDITATFPLGGGGVAYVAPPPIVYAPPVYAPVVVDYYHPRDDWRYRHDRYYHRDWHHDWRDRDHRY